MQVARPYPAARLREALALHPAVALLGPRQCGKTTLARAIARESSIGAWFDLEDPADRRRLEVPLQALAGLRGLVVIDGIQRRPSLCDPLRALLDRPGYPAKLLMLGTASPTLALDVSESLAGHAAVENLGGFSIAEVGSDSWRTLWQRGCFPRSFLAPGDRSSVRWRRRFVRDFLERDLPQMGVSAPSEPLYRFWTMVAHWHGKAWNAAEFSRAMGASQALARKYLGILAGGHMVRVLPAWIENLRKRQVKSPKLYVCDSGLLHTLLSVDRPDALAGHPKVGASFKGFVLEQVAGAFDSAPYFWATHAGAELDFLIHVEGRRHGFECKYADAPSTTKSMRAALRDLSLEHLWVVYPGEEAYSLDDRITAIPASRIPEFARSLSKWVPTKSSRTVAA